ncbi:MAG: RHS repeat-associated core domain-containing protein [Terracidiphilus sp.]
MVRDADENMGAPPARMVEIGSGSPYTQFVYSPAGTLLAVYNDTSGLVKGTVPLPGGETAVYNASGLNFIRHTDWLGSSRLATTWTHGVYAKEAYAPFGETYDEAGTADRSFTGQDQDVVTGSGGTGVYDFLFRKHDPSAGRWMIPDPYGWGAVDLTNPQSFNRYAYVMNNPTTFIDSFGLFGNGQMQPPGSSGQDSYWGADGCLYVYTYSTSYGPNGQLYANVGTPIQVYCPTSGTGSCPPGVTCGPPSGSGGGGGGAPNNGPKPQQPQKNPCPPGTRMVGVGKALWEGGDALIAANLAGIHFFFAGAALTAGCLDPTPFEPATCAGGVFVGATFGTGGAILTGLAVHDAGEAISGIKQAFTCEP